MKTAALTCLLLLLSAPALARQHHLLIVSGASAEYLTGVSYLQEGQTG